MGPNGPFGDDARGAVAPPPAAHGDAYYSYSLSRQAWYRQDYPEALRYMQQAMESDPNAADLALDLARLHMEISQPEEAARAARHAVDLAPGSVAAQRLLADSLFLIATKDSAGDNADNGAINQAYQAYRKVVQMDPDDAEALLNLGKLQISRGDLKESLDSLQRHLQLAPASDEGTFIAAQVLVRLSRFEEAEKLLETAVQRNPTNAQLGLALVDAYEEQGNLDAAMSEARRMEQRRIEPIRVQFVLAQLSQRMGKPADSFEHLKKMADLMDARPGEFSDADRSELELRIIQTLLDAGKVDDAIARSIAGAHRYAQDPRFDLRRGEALLVAGRSAQAEALFREKLKAATGEGDATQGGTRQQISDTYLAAAARQERAKRLGEAESLLRKSIEWNGQNAAALNYLGYMLADRGERLDEAITLVRRALVSDPKNGAYLDSLGWAFFKKKEYVQAEKALEDALSYMAEEPAIHDHLGDVYYATGRTDDAVRAWQQALERGAEHPDLIRAKLAAASPAVTPP
ncbi:MAG TPA: tetratricopeptide repeat protein [Patescibacteria group bacterium]|nr:tetratricopeptide repeat protein [Patescibacteria group bacterium]